MKLQKQGMKPHNALDAEMAAGMGAPDNGVRVNAAKNADEDVLLMAE